MKISINAVSIIDLFAAVLGIFVAALFFYRSFRVGIRRNAEFLFAIQTFFVVLFCLCIFKSDNVVSADVTPSAVAESASKTTLWWYRLMFVLGNFVLATITHFALRFSEYSTPRDRPLALSDDAEARKTRGKTTRWIIYSYFIAIGAMPACLLESFFKAREIPLQNEICFSCVVPFQPVYGPLFSIYMILWIFIIVHAAYTLAKKRAASPKASTRTTAQGGYYERKWFIILGVGAWGFTGFVSMIEGFKGWAGFDFSMLVVIGAMLSLTVGLLNEQISREQNAGRQVKISVDRRGLRPSVTGSIQRRSGH